MSENGWNTDGWSSPTSSTERGSRNNAQNQQGWQQTNQDLWGSDWITAIRNHDNHNAAIQALSNPQDRNDQLQVVDRLLLRGGPRSPSRRNQSQVRGGPRYNRPRRLRNLNNEPSPRNPWAGDRELLFPEDQQVIPRNPSIFSQGLLVFRDLNSNDELNQASIQIQDSSELQNENNFLDGVDIPSELTCPITHSLMREPVLLVESGQVYEKSEILKWLQRSNRDPVTNVQIMRKDIAPIHVLRSRCEEIRQKHRETANIGNALQETVQEVNQTISEVFDKISLQVRNEEEKLVSLEAEILQVTQQIQYNVQKRFDKYAKKTFDFNQINQKLQDLLSQVHSNRNQGLSRGNGDFHCKEVDGQLKETIESTLQQRSEIASHIQHNFTDEFFQQVFDLSQYSQVEQIQSLEKEIWKTQEEIDRLKNLAKSYQNNICGQSEDCMNRISIDKPQLQESSGLN